VAALFAVHPLHVESVAWVSERKDVLSTFFMLLAIGSYTRFTADARKYGRMVLIAFLFALGLMAKSMVVSLPVLLLLLDFWPLRRLKTGAPWRAQLSDLKGLLLEKTPLFILSLAASAMTMLAQSKSGAMGDLGAFPFWDRVANALFSYWSYIAKMFWPLPLAVFYPYAPVPLWRSIGSALFLLGVTAFTLAQRGKRPYLIVGWLWYVVTLIPVIGLVQVGKQAMADRYTYIPLIGLFIMICWGLGEWAADHRSRKIVLGALFALILGGFFRITQLQIRYWQNSVDLFQHALSVTRDNYVIHRNLGMVYNTQTRFQDATEEFVESIRIKPDTLDSFNDFGNDLAKKGGLEDALACYRAVLRVRPDHAPALFNGAIVLEKLGRLKEARANYEKVLKQMPNNEAVRAKLDFLDKKSSPTEGASTPA